MPFRIFVKIHVIWTSRHLIMSLSHMRAVIQFVRTMMDVSYLGCTGLSEPSLDIYFKVPKYDALSHITLK